MGSPETMRALRRERYGGPGVLSLEVIETPRPQAGQVLLKMRVVSLNLSDWECLVGRPLYTRVFGLLRPRVQILGTDVVGVVEALGEGVSHLDIGDVVFGDVLGQDGGLAEYLCADATRLEKKKSGISDEMAAAIPQAGIIALQAIRDVLCVRKGDRVLINGGGGGSGTFAIQLAKSLGATVTAVDSSEKQEWMRSVGSDEVLDYRTTNFTRTGREYDAILDLVATRSIAEVSRALAPGGRYSAVGGPVHVILALFLFGSLWGRKQKKKIGVLAAEPNGADLQTLSNLVLEGSLCPAIHERYALDTAPEAIRRVGEGSVKGKAVVSISRDP